MTTPLLRPFAKAAWSKVSPSQEHRLRHGRAAKRVDASPFEKGGYSPVTGAIIRYILGLA